MKLLHEKSIWSESHYSSCYEAVDGQLKDAEIVNNRTFDTLAYEASDNSYVKVDNKGSVTFTAKGADGLTMRYSIKDGDKESQGLCEW